MTVRVVVTADNHLNRFVSRLSVTRLEDRRQRLRLAFRRVVDSAIEARAAVLILGGDTFDAIDPRNLERAAFARALRRLQDGGVTVVATGGNHDSPRQTTDHGGYGPFAEFEEAGLLRYLGPPGDDGTMSHVVVEAAGQYLAIAGVAWRPVTGGDPLAGLAFPEIDGPPPDWRIVVTHAGIEGHAYPGPLEPAIRRDTIAALEADILVAGHVHQSLLTVVPCRSGRACHVIVPGSTERMTFGEMGIRPGFAIVELPPHGPPSVTWRAIAAQPRAVLDIPATELAPERLGGLRPDADDPTATIVRRLDAMADPDAMVVLRVYGAVPREVLDDLDLAEVQATGARLFFSFDLDATALVPADPGMAVAPAGARRTAIEEVRATIDSMGIGAGPEELATLEDAWSRILPLLGGLDEGMAGAASPASGDPDAAS